MCKLGIIETSIREILVGKSAKWRIHLRRQAVVKSGKRWQQNSVHHKSKKRVSVGARTSAKGKTATKSPVKCSRAGARSTQNISTVETQSTQVNLVPETSVQAVPSAMTSEPSLVSLADVSHERIQVGQEKGMVTPTPHLVSVTHTQVPCSSAIISSTSTTITASCGQPICSTGISSQSMASSRSETSLSATINPATPGPSSETMSVSMQGMMKEMVRLMQNMAKGEKGHEEVIDLSQVPKAGSCGKSAGKGKKRRKISKQVRPRESSESETTSSSEGESDATSDDGHTLSLEDSPRNIDYEKTPKLPSFTGSESWKVWFNCFDDVACRRNWSEEK